MATAAVAAVLLAGLVAVAALYARELMRVTAFLRELPEDSNLLLSAPLPLPGLKGLVGAVNQRIGARRREAAAALAREGEFHQGLASLSHDIRTPLAGAKGYLQLAADGEAGPQQQAYLRAAEARLEVMQGLLDQLFAYTQSMAAHGAPAGQVDAVAVLGEVLLGNFPVFEERGWQPEVALGKEPLPLMADGDALARVFENVVGNALAHGAPPFSVVREGRALRFRNGLPEGARPDAARVFERFYRGDASRGSAGAGLGLAVVKNLCDGMGVQASAQVEDGAFQLVLEFPAPAL
ncbi:sensor histidine kinase [Parvibacter caecicola]|uniref:Sensor-like histidine kinase SenX3 n=1 Tax=Parvibacter caecicola TaxID=747645 RepID=A0A4T9TAJ1_9ACTN|nr:HAMP domain-containing sensor histidine kinase [Parvibacter caecicola]TJW11235.1 HAMP domain-containing histidine kinase [Parvibacter caecicola]